MRTLLAGLFALALAGPSVAQAHATLVIGTMTFAPDPLAGGGTVTVSIVLEDPGLVEVEDAVVFLELRRAPESTAVAENEQPRGDALHVSDRLEEVSPGLYRAALPVPDAGHYTLSLRDRTYRQEEAVANVVVEFGTKLGEVMFVLPPTATGPASLGTWLLWLIVVPLIAGVVVTVLVLRGGRDGETAAGTTAEGAEGEPGDTVDPRP